MKALITGASGGIGMELALLLKDKYDTLVLVARTKEKLLNLKNEIEKDSKTKVEIEPLDISIKENCINLFEKHKDVDFLINNAGFGDIGFFDETSLDKEISMINTNIVAYHILTKLYLKEMKSKNSGHILNVASIAGFMPGPLMSTYYATKSYVLRLSEGIRTELKKSKSKVKISVLCPGPVSTGFEKAANISFNFHGTDVKYVAKYTMKHINRFYIIPRFSVKLGRFLIKILPSNFVSKFIYKFQSGRK